MVHGSSTPTSAPTATSTSRSRSTVSLVVHAGGLVVIYSVYSLLQEKIMKTGYNLPPQQPQHQHQQQQQQHEHDQIAAATAKFTSASLLVLSNRLFSLLTGIALSLWRPAPSPTGESTSMSRTQRLTPKWPMLSYAMVAAANFASTYCQYDALKYVGFTTQALAKCAKMVPVLVIGTLFYKKSYRQKEYVAGAVVLLGCFIYLFSPSSTSAIKSLSNKKAHSHGQSNQASAIDNPLAPIIGCVLLGSYLFFDGLTSTTQEYYFGKSKKDVAPLTPGGPVLDQMVFVNLVATGISGLLCLASFESTMGSLYLAINNPALVTDIFLLSATATFGLIVLYDTIFKHGALTVATTMTLRQFFSILLNAGVFGNFHLIGFGGWLGVGFVAAGVFIKMDRRFDNVTRPAPTAVPSISLSSPLSSSSVNRSRSGSDAALLADTSGDTLVEDMTDHARQKLGKSADEKIDMDRDHLADAEQQLIQQGADAPVATASNVRRMMLQYGVPLSIPLAFALASTILL